MRDSADMWIVFLILALVVLLALVLVLVILIYIYDFWKFLEIPHEKPRKIWDLFKNICGRGALANEDAQQHYTELYQQFKGVGPFCGFYHLLRPRVLVLERELVKQIMIRDFSNFNSRGGYQNFEDDPLSSDLYSRAGSRWKDMRLKLEPIFSRPQVRQLYSRVYAESLRLLEAFDAEMRQQPNESVIDIRQQMHRYVLSIIASLVFGLTEEQRLKYPLSEFDAMTQLALTTRRHGNFVSSILNRYPLFGRWLHIATTPRKAETYFLNMIADMVEQRQKSSADTQDYLQMLIDIKTQELSTHEIEEPSAARKLKPYLQKELAAHAFGFLKMGLTPTAHTLSYVLYELAFHQDNQQRVRQEVNTVRAKYNNEYSYECLQELEYMGQVISETIRLHPVTPFITRRTLTDYPVPNHPHFIIPASMYVIIPIYAMHNDPANYPEPQLFNPKRFSAEATANRDPSTWLGFGEGARSCLGVHFAQLQMRLALAMLLTKYEFSVDSKRVMINCQEGVSLRVDQLNSESGEREVESII